MCGITAVIGYDLPKSNLINSLKALSHRGPDGTGIFVDRENLIHLGHSRLSIIDIEHGAQPLTNEAKDLVLVCNGEIYGHEDIRDDLVSKGYQFSTSSDSEVIIHLYKEYGTSFLDHLRGEFTFVLYDVKKKTVFAVRDRFGIKPLFYNEIDGKFIFSSEAKGVFGTGLIKPEIDPIEIRNTLSFSIPDSIFKGVRQLSPGTYLKIESGKKAKTYTYWDINLQKDSAPELKGKPIELTQKIVREKVESAVKDRLRSDVPLGVYLSGGIDSAAIAGTAAKFIKDDFHAFTISFSDDKQFNELALARKMANSIGAKLHVVEATNDTLIDNFEDSLWYSESPTGNLHGVGKFLLSKLAAKHVKVVLTGEGSDEIFLGYEYFKDPTNIISNNLLGNLNKKKKKKEKIIQGKHIDELEKKIGFVPQHEMRSTFSAKMQKFLTSLFARNHRSELDASHPIDGLLKRLDLKDTQELPLVRKIQHFSIKGIMTPYILSTLGDRAEMSHSIEGRTPLLDHELFEMARSIPDDHKIRNQKEKYVFREAMKDRVIEEIYESKKWPFTAPPFLVRKSTSPAMSNAINTHLSKAAIQTAGIFDYRCIRKLLIIIKFIPFDSQMRRDLNTLLVFIISVQSLQAMYETKFQETIDKKFVGVDLPLYEVKLDISAGYTEVKV